MLTTVRRHARLTGILATAGAAAVALGGATPGSTAGTAADPLTRLAGRWAGQGTVTPASGTPESFKCVITYFPSEDGAGLKQNLRCKSDNYRLDTSTMLQISGQSVSGRWEEKIYGLDGAVSGSVTADGFDVVLSGRFFRARMAVAGNGCEQSVKVSPDRRDYIREVEASLRKC